VSGVVDLAVVIAHGTHQGVLAECWEEAASRSPAQVAMGGYSMSATQHVVQGDAAADVEPFPPSVLQWIQERHRLRQVRAEVVQDQTALPQCFSHQTEVQLFEVAKASVDELARPA
jgi:hypothetical protein